MPNLAMWPVKFPLKNLVHIHHFQQNNGEDTILRLIGEKHLIGEKNQNLKIIFVRQWDKCMPKNDNHSALSLNLDSNGNTNSGDNNSSNDNRNNNNTKTINIIQIICKR